MMSALGDAGQRPKKKLPMTNGRPAAKSRSQTSAAPAPNPQTASSASQMEPQTPAKDIYDYDFVDDLPPVAKPPARPKPFNSTKTPARPLTSSTSTASAAAPPASKPTLPSIQRPATARGVTEAARGVKRKPSQIESASKQSLSAASRINSTAQPKRAQRASPSPDPVVTASSPPLYKNARTVGRVAVPSSSLPSTSPFRQPPPKTPPRQTPPRNTASLKSPIDIRSLSVSPKKNQPTMTANTAKSYRKAQAAQSSQQMPFRPLDNHPLSSQAAPQPPLDKLPQAARPSPAAQRPLQTRPPAQRKRRRLIDTLAAQREEESSSEDDARRKEVAGEDGDDDSSLADTVGSRHLNVRSTPASEDRAAYMEVDSLVTASPGKASVAPSTPATVTRRVTARRPGVKFTYNLERTMLAEEPVVLGGAGGNDLSLLESLLPEPEPKPNAFDFDDDMGGPSQGAIQSIHELRQAGANSRFADELVDIMDRVGTPSSSKPSSTRRSALLEMVQKLQEKSFLRHFRDQGAEVQLFRDVGKESDVVAGFSIVCIVVTLLANGSASHRLLRDFRQQKIKDLFSVLLGNDSDIVTLSKDRKTNVSGYVRQLLTELRGIMQKLQVWKPAPGAPSQLSPRTMSLKALHMFAQQLQAASGGVGGLDEDDGALSSLITRQLFDILSASLPSAYDDDGSSPTPSLFSSGLTKDAESIDLHLALSLLEMHSVSAMQSDISAEWTRRYIPIVANALEEALQQHQQRNRRFNDLELLILKLALNTANNNPDAARYYVDKGLLRRLAELSSASLAAVVRSIKAGEDFPSDALNELLLMLGVMINFSENDVSAGETLVQGGGSAVFDQLGKCFLDGRAITAEADSEEKSQLNVAFAYLSILLGYLCLHEPVYEAFKRLSPSGNLKPLLDSIRHFIALHDQLGKTDNTDHGAEMNQFTARLRALAHELEIRA